jgi:hypothetical protein
VTKVNVAISSQQVVYSSYLGGASDDFGYGIAIDALTNAYVTGQTRSFNFPTYPPKVAGYQATLRGTADAFIVKFNASGTALLYSTYLGGTGEESGNAIDVDSSNNAYVNGLTTSTAAGAFPTLNPRQPSYGGIRDAFVTKMNAAGTGLVYSTYLGGNGSDVGNSIEVYTNPGGNYAYVVGQSQSSSGFPLNFALDNSLGGTSDAFLTRFDVGGNTLIFSTYLGGTGLEEATDLVIDPSGNAYVTGWTNSSAPGFPTTPDAKQPDRAGAEDAFITQFNASGNSILYSTFFGGAD